MTDDQECEISFFGYVRGASMRICEKVHIPGLGDFPVKSITTLMDPCPTLSKEKAKLASKKEKRTLKKT